MYQLEGLHPTSIDNNITSNDHCTYCKTDDDDDDDDDGVDNDTDYVVDVDVDVDVDVTARHTVSASHLVGE